MRRNKIDETQNLQKIKSFVEGRLQIVIGDKCRDEDTVNARALYYKIAMKNTHASKELIGSIVGRSHATVIHAIKATVPYIESIEEHTDLYNEYTKDNGIDSIKIEFYEKQLEELYFINKSLIKQLKKNKEASLTENELAYRQLTDDEQSRYDHFAKVKLKSFQWITDKNEYESITCEA